MTEDIIKNCAEQVRAYIQTLPNYSLASAKMAAEALGLPLESDDIPLFMKTLLRTPYPPKGNYAHLQFKHTIRDCHKAYEEVVQIARNNMVNRIIIERRTLIDDDPTSPVDPVLRYRKTEYIEIIDSEVEIRHYDENGNLIIGHIYPIPREDGINILIQADQWISELPKPEKVKCENGKCIRILEDGTEVPLTPSQRPSTYPPLRWEAEFLCHQAFLRDTKSTDPRSPHADAIKEIIIKHLPDLEPYLF